MRIAIERRRASEIEGTLGPLRCGSKAVALITILLAGSKRASAFSGYNFNVRWIKHFFGSLKNYKQKQINIYCSFIANFAKYV